MRVRQGDQALPAACLCLISCTALPSAHKMETKHVPPKCWLAFSVWRCRCRGEYSGYRRGNNGQWLAFCCHTLAVNDIFAFNPIGWTPLEQVTLASYPASYTWIGRCINFPTLVWQKSLQFCICSRSEGLF